MLRRRIVNVCCSPICHPLRSPAAFYTYQTSGWRPYTSRCPRESLSGAANNAGSKYSLAFSRRFYHRASTFFPTPPLLDQGPPFLAGLGSSRSTPNHVSHTGSAAGAFQRRSMSQDRAEVPCSTQLTIGDVVIPVPDYAVHPERVTWATPGVDHTAPYLTKADTPSRGMADGAALDVATGLPPLHNDGAAAGEENMFFTVQDPLTRSYLRWIAQKEQLGQDMCLIGDPGPAMRWLVMLYSHLTRREIRVVYLNSDITESDLKQRREIRNGSLIYDDQSAVSAAVEGQLLVLEGLERVERNVLPVINNLLENREMHLDNGSVLIHPARYDSLLQKLYESKLQQRHSSSGSLAEGSSAVARTDLIAEAKHELAQMGLVRVSEKFRVIGITVPVPPYEGNPLDPPLRSRFQCLYVRTPLPVVAPSSSVLGALEAKVKAGDDSRKRSKRLAELQERQSVRFAQVAQVRAAITAINDSTRDFQLSKPSKKKKTTGGQEGGRQGQQHFRGGRYGSMYDSTDVVEQMFGNEAGTTGSGDGAGGEDGEDARSDRSSSTSAAAASSPLQTLGHWGLATIAQQLAIFPDMPVGEAVTRGFPWPYYARQLTRSGAGGAATGYASVEEYHRRLAHYAEVLQHCHVYPPLLLAANLAAPAKRSASQDGDARRSGSAQRRARPPAEPMSKSSRIGARLRSVVHGEGADVAGDEPQAAATARAYVRSAQLVSSLSTTDSRSQEAPAAMVPLPVQQACNYVLKLRNADATATFSGVPVVVAEAVIATAAHDAEHPGEPGTYPLKVFLGAAALSTDALGGPSAAAAPWERDVAAYLTTTAAPATVFTTEHYHVLQTMLQVHASRQHMCLLGPTGCGKTAMVRAFGRLLGYEGMSTMHLYADMTNKDLFQQRMTDPKTGNTTWQDSPLLHAAIYGKLVVLDGMEKLPGGMLSSLQQILVDQSAVLADGTILKPPTEYNLLKEKMVQRDLQTGQVIWRPTDADMRARKIFPVHPAFRVVATARPPVPVSGGGGGGSSGGKGGKDFFVTPDLTTLFRVVAMPDAGEDALGPVLRQVAHAEIRLLHAETWRHVEPAAAVQQRSEAVVEQLLQLRNELEELHASDGKMPQLSLRQLRQLVRAAVRYPSRVEESVRNTLLLPLMTGVAATKVRHALETCGLAKGDVSHTGGAGDRGAAAAASKKQKATAEYEVLAPEAVPLPVKQVAGAAGPRSTSSDRLWSVNGEPVLRLTRAYTQKELALVPYVTGFHANRVHESILAWLAKQYAMQSSILLIGNQGVGKNKVVDAFLSRLGIPRHYIQLHRDTTVGSLTINPTVEAGKVVWEDSPLVKAVQQGHCLVVDEIDKAPVEVVQVLKGLIEDREMRLGDGRQIYDPALERALPATMAEADITSGSAVSGAAQRIAIHPDFRIIVLANPPGFPFHGNDFFRECGDLFAAYVMGNPDAESQLRVLSAYAPTLPRVLLERLVSVFIELQNAFTQGNLTYPFSLRELIAVVKHMSRYPQDGVYEALNNVFNFDARDENTLRLVRQVLGHYLQPMVQHGGLQRLRPYRAGQPMPLMPFKELVTLPVAAASASTASAPSAASASAAFPSLITLPAEVAASPSAFLQRIVDAQEKEKHSKPEVRAAQQAAEVWSTTYPTEAFFPSSSSASAAASNALSEAFTEWASQCTLPFVNARTDTVLCITSVTAVGGGGTAGEETTEATLPLASVLLERRGGSTGAKGAATAAAESASSPPRRLIVATVRLPPSSIDARRLVADTAEEVATLWPVGHVRFVDVTQHFAQELQTEATTPSFAFAGIRMNAQGLPWSTAVSDDEEAAARGSAAATPAYTWPPSLGACSSSPHRHSRATSALRAWGQQETAAERIPQGILLVSASTTGRTVLVDVLAGPSSDLYLARMGVVGSAEAEAVTKPEASSAVSAGLGPVLPLHLDRFVNGVTGTGSDVNDVRVLDTSAAHGLVAFAPPVSSPSASTCCVLLQGHIVQVAFPHPVTSLRWVGEQVAMVELAGSIDNTGAKAGVVKVYLAPDGAAQALFLPLSGEARHLRLVEVAEGVSASEALTPLELAGSVWRVVRDGPVSESAPTGKTPGTGGAGAVAEAVEDPRGRNVVYARAEGATDKGLQLRYYQSTSEASAGSAAALTAPDSRVLVDEARHQLLQVQGDGRTLTAVDTQHGTLRTFATLPGSGSTSASAGGARQDRWALDTRSGTAYAWSSASQHLSVADVDAERVRQRYAEWSSLLSGDAETVGDAATVEEGEEAVKDFKMKYSTPRKQPSGTLKHGEIDDKEHHGGNTWAGGTGGTDTAGLGGMVGPYRLDKGNEVHQVSPEMKRKVPKHLLEEARRMGREALKERLQSIGMTEAEYEEYKRLQERVRPAVAQLRTLLMGLKAAEGERVWMTGQTDGVWDDKKLVEGIVGEKNVYKRRVDTKETNPFQQRYKKRLVFVLDVSASMYRFNGMDKRLTKLLETTVMIMEAFAGFESKLDYAMIGHNGDSDNIPLVNFGAPPANQKERMVICQKMVAYAQYCWAGDNTVEAMRRSVELVTKEKGDSYFVFVISDANLQRYGITPRELTEIIQSKPEVKMFCVFIATLGAQASHLQQQLPAGHGYECMRTDLLPQVMRQIFTSANLF